MNPIIALDVDGVLSPVSGGDIPEAALAVWSQEDFIQATSPGSFNLWAVKPVVDFLRELHNSGRAEILWCTSWREEAANILAPDLQLPHWPQIVDESGFWSEGWWKLEAVKSKLSEGRRVIWLDDDIADSIESGEITKELAANKDLFIVSPDVRVGLTLKDINSIDAKLKEWGYP